MKYVTNLCRFMSAYVKLSTGTVIWKINSILFFLVSLQFIVVSLKDGMFNNANVLYKTKFVDGVSTVTRYAQQQSSLPPSVPASFARGKSTTTKKTSAKRARTEPLTEKTN